MISRWISHWLSRRIGRWINHGAHRRRATCTLCTTKLSWMLIWLTRLEHSDLSRWILWFLLFDFLSLDSLWFLWLPLIGVSSAFLSLNFCSVSVSLSFASPAFAHSSPKELRSERTFLLSRILWVSSRLKSNWFARLLGEEERSLIWQIKLL